MSQENVELVCDQFQATNERDFPRAMSYYAEDVELVVDPDAFLELGTFKGATRLESGLPTGSRHLSLATTSRLRKRGISVTLSFSSQPTMGGGGPVEWKSTGKRDTSTSFAAARLFASSFIPAAPLLSKPPGCRSSGAVRKLAHRSVSEDLHAPKFVPNLGPGQAFAGGADRGSSTKRYPIPGSVIRYRGCAGSGSSLRRSCARYTRR
jgi:hypothetical protein